MLMENFACQCARDADQLLRGVITSSRRTASASPQNVMLDGIVPNFDSHAGLMQPFADTKRKGFSSDLPCK